MCPGPVVVSLVAGLLVAVSLVAGLLVAVYTPPRGGHPTSRRGS